MLLYRSSCTHNRPRFTVRLLWSKWCMCFSSRKSKSPHSQNVPVTEKQYIFITGIIMLKKSYSSSHSVSQQKKEDVTYASIVHSTEKRSRSLRAPSDADCEYSVVQAPAAPHRSSAASSSNDCEEDYVLMG